MALSTLIRRMTEAGAPPEAIAIAVEEVEALTSSLDARRAYERDRKRDYRERQKTANVTGQNGTCPGQNGTASEKVSPQTPLPKIITLPKRISKDIPKGVPTGTQSRATAWVEGRAFPTEWLNWARTELGWTSQQAAQEAGRFIDSALAKRRTYVDWKAAWRQWCRSPFQKTVAPRQEALTL